MMESEKSEAIRSQLKELGLTQVWLAEKMGVSVSGINMKTEGHRKWGRYYEKARDLLLQAKASGVKKNELFVCTKSVTEEPYRIVNTYTSRQRMQDWKFRVLHQDWIIDASIEDEEGDCIFFFDGEHVEMYRKDGTPTTSSREMGR